MKLSSANTKILKIEVDKAKRKIEKKEFDRS